MALADVVVIGAGQAGLASSHQLTAAGIDHIVLERHRVGHSWAQRWDSFSLVIPNWTVQLPGFPYDGNDPDGFMPRDEIVSHLERYAASFGAPVREGVGVERLEEKAGGWAVGTSDGEIQARAVVVATGSFSVPVRPEGARDIPPTIEQVAANEYRAPDSLAPGGVLVVGSGQSGCQIAEDLVRAGREVFLACGRAPWLPRRVGDRDVFWYIDRSGFMDVSLASLESPRERLGANPQLSGRDGGRDLHFRTLSSSGVALVGRFTGFDGSRVRFAADLGESVAFGDQAYTAIADMIRRVAREHGIDVGDDLPAPPPLEIDSPDALAVERIGAIVWTGGFRPDYSRWIDRPEVFDDLGFPLQDDTGVGPLSGLHFVGTHFLRKRRSALLSGVGEDAEVVVEALVRGLAR